MHKLFLGLGLFVFMGIIAVLTSQNVSAISNGPVVYQLQTQGSGGVAVVEYVSVKNTSTIPVDVTNWCVVYSSSTDITQTTLKCLTPPDVNTKIWLDGGGYISFATNEFLALHFGYVPDGIFSAGIAASAGHIKLVDANKDVIDKLGWGSAASPETTAKTAHSSGSILQRNDSDTDNNAVDFVQTTLGAIPVSGLYEEVIPVDQCPNTPDLDITIPIGYTKDTDGNCYEDVCDNISGLQKVLPNGYYQDGIDCVMIELKITELLPNVSGSDTDKEFVEIYNPTNYTVDLGGYILQLGPSYSKNYVLPSVVLLPNTSVYLSDTQTTMTLPNTTASVRLMTPDSQTVDETAIYLDPKDDQAWALFADSWQYTNQPTPGNSNLVSVGGLGAGEDNELQPCAEGKYRNPETNRCRNIETDAGAKPCVIDQIRNPETNRCRSIFASDSGLAPCKPGQTRNPDTNRCRSTASTGNTLKACAANQERNPETNRCRKKAASTVAATNVQDIESKTQAEHGGWLLAGTASIGLAGYGVAEWREELGLLGRKLATLLGKNPPTD